MTAAGYVLATGTEGAARLSAVDDVHGADSRAFLQRAGICDGMSAMDLGCGSGNVTWWMAGIIGARGSMTGVDNSARQLAAARNNQTMPGSAPIRYICAEAHQTGIVSDQFDLIFCRFLLMHAHRPQEVLFEAKRLLKPGGILAVEDGDFSSPFCWPGSRAFQRCFELYRAAGREIGADFQIGRSLYDLVYTTGLCPVSVSLAQPLIVSGDAKALPQRTLEEVRPALIAAGLTNKNEIDDIVISMDRLAVDDKVLFGMARMTQVIATKE